MGIFQKGEEFYEKAKKELGSGMRFKIEAGERIKIRFLQERSEIVGWYQHNIRRSGFYRGIPCVSVERPCLLCAEPSSNLNRRTFRFATYIWNYKTNKVEIYEQGTTIMSDIVIMNDKYSTILDRDYEIARKGTGRDTKYTLIPEVPSSFEHKDKTKVSELPPLEKQIRVFSDEEINEILHMYKFIGTENEETKEPEKHKAPF